MAKLHIFLVRRVEIGAGIEGGRCYRRERRVPVLGEGLVAAGSVGGVDESMAVIGREIMPEGS